MRRHLNETFFERFYTDQAEELAVTEDGRKYRSSTKSWKQAALTAPSPPCPTRLLDEVGAETQEAPAKRRLLFIPILAVPPFLVTVSSKAVMVELKPLIHSCIAKPFPQ